MNSTLEQLVANPNTAVLAILLAVAYAFAREFIVLGSVHRDVVHDLERQNVRQEWWTWPHEPSTRLDVEPQRVACEHCGRMDDPDVANRCRGCGAPWLEKRGSLPTRKKAR